MAITDNTEAYAYVRVSPSNREEKNTHENQIREIKRYAQENNLTVLDGEFPEGNWFIELDTSGASDNRDKLNIMLDNLDQVSQVLFYDWSRISRNQLYSGYLLYEFDKKGVKLHDVSKKRIIELENEDSVFMQQLESYFAHKERKKIKERQKLGIRRYIEKFGRWGRKERVLTPKEIAEYQRLREAGVSKCAIARVFKMSRAVLYRNIKKLKLEEIQSKK